MRLGQLIVGMLVLAGCAKKAPVAAAVVMKEDALLTAVRARPSPDPAQAKLSVKVSSRKLGIAAPPLAGGLILDRPGRAYFTMLSPFGSPVLTLTSDGTGVQMLNTQDHQFIYADDAAVALQGASGGTIGIDDVVGLLLGQLPLDPAKVRGREPVEGGVRFLADGPGGTSLAVVVEEMHATPVRVDVADAGGAPLVSAAYEPFVEVGAWWLPSRVILEIAPVELSVDVRFKTWAQLDQAPEVFHAIAPEGYTSITFQEYSATMKEKLAEQP
ncbi:MAG TPA: hypothetical protein PKA64_05375 [Myxococcota bacterium]|nr:hypothetical protein [Myxococcota bacterium]